MPAAVSVVIVSYDVKGRLATCIRSVLASRDVKVELHVVDNGSTDGSPALVRGEFAGVQLIENPDNRGFAAASNQGIRATRAPYVLSLNPDTEVEPDAIAKLAEYMEAHSEVGAVGPKIVRPDGSLDLASRRSFPSPSVAFFRLSRLSRLFPAHHRLARYNLTYRSPDVSQEIDSGTGACLLFRRAALDQVGLFDEAFFMYGEDLDLCYRLKASGWKVMYHPSAVILHHKGQSSRKQSYRMIREFHRSMVTFFGKHYRSTTSAPVARVIVAGIWLRCAGQLFLNALRREKRVSK